ncbi:unnamed protein product [Merluccius merluccius]
MGQFGKMICDHEDIQGPVGGILSTKEIHTDQLKGFCGDDTLQRCSGFRLRGFTENTSAATLHILLNISSYAMPEKSLPCQPQRPLLTLVTGLIMDTSQDCLFQ